MSRLGKTPIALPSGVEVKFEKGKANVKGPKGQLEVPLNEGIDVAIEGGEAIVKWDGENTAFHGLYRSLINNAVIGVSKGFEKILSLVGVGYRAAVSGNELDMQLGYSHPTKLTIPQGIEVKVLKGTEIVISGIDKQKVGQFAAQARAIRPPEPYKGKGVRYKDEHVRKKAGKAAKGK